MPTTPTSTEEEIGFSQMCLRTLLQRKLKHLDGRRLYVHVGPLDTCGNLLIDCTPQAPKRKQASPETKVFFFYQDGFFPNNWLEAQISPEDRQRRNIEKWRPTSISSGEKTGFSQNNEGFSWNKDAKKRFFPRWVFLTNWSHRNLSKTDRERIASRTRTEQEMAMALKGFPKTGFSQPTERAEISRRSVEK